MKGFKGLPGGANMQGLLQQAQKMQKDMARAQEEAEAFESEGSAGGGAVKVRVNGKYEVLSVEIKPEAVDPSDVEMLQDAIRIACNDALTKIKDNTQTKLSSVTGGLSIPGL
jgi:DNA-binding YbaB/EbfC family protein